MDTMLLSIHPLTFIGSFFQPFFFSSLFITFSILIGQSYMFRNMYSLKPFTTSCFHTISNRLHIQWYHSKMQTRPLLFVWVGQRLKMNLTDLPYVFVSGILSTGHETWQPLYHSKNTNRWFLWNYICFLFLILD